MKHLQPPDHLVDQWMGECTSAMYLRDQFRYVARCAAIWGNSAIDSWTSLLDTDLPPELLNPLRRANIHTVEQVKSMCPQQLQMIRTLGPARIARIRKILEAYD